MTVAEMPTTPTLSISCDREMLLHHAQLAARGVSSRTSIQVLQGIMLAAHDGELHLAATDMELSVRTRVPASVEQEGVAVLPGKLLVDILRHLSGETVSLAYDDRTVVIASEGSEYRLNVYDSDDFPQLPPTGGSLFSIDRDTFVDTVQAVSRAAGTDESRPVLTGINMHLTSEQLVMVATDSYRLSVRTTDVDVSIPEAINAIVPARALDELVRIANASPAGSLAVGMTETHILIGVDETWVTARLIEGQFPNHDQLIPGSFEAEAVVDRAMLLDIVNRTRLLTRRDSPLKFSFADGTLTVSAQTQDVGAAQETLAVDYNGEPMSIGLNADFLRDGLQSIESDTATVQLISPLRPALLVGEDPNFSYLIMPVRLPE